MEFLIDQTMGHIFDLFNSGQGKKSHFQSLFDSGQVIGQSQVNSCIPKMLIIDSLGNQFGGTLTFNHCEIQFKNPEKVFCRVIRKALGAFNHQFS